MIGSRSYRIALALSMLPLLTGAGWTQTPSELFSSDFQKALTLYRAGRFSQAASALEALAQRQSDSFEVHELLGLSYRSLGRNAESMQQLQTAVALQPASAMAHTNLAASLFHAGRLGDAETESRAAARLEPESFDANHNLAQVLLQENKLADAIPFLEAAQRSRADAYNNGYDLALAYLLTGRLQEANKSVAALLAQKDAAELHSLLGQIEEKEGKYLEAEKEFEVAAHMEPSEESLFAWASELLLHRTYEPAILVFREGTQRFPKSPRLWIGLGMALYSRGEYEDSVRSLLTAAELDPRDARCYLFLSKAYLSSPTQAQQVVERFQRYSELEPKNALAQFYYGMGVWKGLRVEGAEVNYAQVEALLQRSLALNGRNAEVHLQLGILYNDERAYDKALPEFERALQLNPELADAHFRLGRSYLRAGEKVKAQEEFDTFKQLQARHQDAVDKERAEVQQFVVAAKAETTHGASGSTP